MSQINESTRKIIHIDMDAYFAAIEQRDHPQWRGKPLIVGGAPNSRGVVATCSYEARRYGIHSAMPSARAYQLCPQALFVKPRFEIYQQVSLQIREIFQHYTDLVEPLSLDEAYLDVTGSTLHRGSASLIAQEIRQRIRQKTQLTASAGVSYNKFLAKLACERGKPDGLFVIMPSEGAAHAAALPIDRFHGIGRSTASRMRSLGIEFGADLLRFGLPELEQHFGKLARHYHGMAAGIDPRPVNPSRIRQSIGAETTFADDLTDSAQMVSELERLLDRVTQELQQTGQRAQTLTVKVRFSDFRSVTRGMTLRQGFASAPQVDSVLKTLLQRALTDFRPVRLLGITVSGLQSADHSQPRQLTLW
ncbi:MAG TPA: DNA polymerase IV [Pseudomonadales bacterium]|nr:DNA polymerase IV [Pseudomonadales bacterium]HND28184.1 DNA polymerase IV [Pseudomonadales bacterium]HNF75003.1 DNA polymerase IV [Pseudomonadales bacterium]HNH20281.1 DNA polymerase IV [Pseudomonadales bacterium]HNL32590.1 DNA polymerase IV [Pseudomonadales bacterium]